MDSLVLKPLNRKIMVLGAQKRKKKSEIGMGIFATLNDSL